MLHPGINAEQGHNLEQPCVVNTSGFYTQQQALGGDVVRAEQFVECCANVFELVAHLKFAYDFPFGVGKGKVEFGLARVTAEEKVIALFYS